MPKAVRSVPSTLAENKCEINEPFTTLQNPTYCEDLSGGPWKKNWPSSTKQLKIKIGATEVQIKQTLRVEEKWMGDVCSVSLSFLSLPFRTSYHFVKVGTDWRGQETGKGWLSNSYSKNSESRACSHVDSQEQQGEFYENFVCFQLVSFP